MRITGSLFYQSVDLVILEFTGEEVEIKRVIDKCEKEEFISEIHIMNRTKTTKKLTDFIMLNQID